MAQGKKIVKVLLWIFIPLILIVGGVVAYFYFGDSGKRNAMEVIPDDAISKSLSRKSPGFRRRNATSSIRLIWPKTAVLTKRKL